MWQCCSQLAWWAAVGSHTPLCPLQHMGCSGQRAPQGVAHMPSAALAPHMLLLGGLLCIFAGVHMPWYMHKEVPNGEMPSLVALLAMPTWFSNTGAPCAPTLLPKGPMVCKWPSERCAMRNLSPWGKPRHLSSTPGLLCSGICWPATKFVLDLDAPGACSRSPLHDVVGPYMYRQETHTRGRQRAGGVGQ